MPTSNFQPIRLLDPDCCYKVLNGKQCRPRSVGIFRSQQIWIYTVCKGRVYLGSAGTLSANSADDKLMIFFLIFFPRKQCLVFHARLLGRHFAWNAKPRFLGKIFQNAGLWNYHAGLVQLVIFPWVRNFNLLVLGKELHSSSWTSRL